MLSFLGGAWASAKLGSSPIPTKTSTIKEVFLLIAKSRCGEPGALATGGFGVSLPVAHAPGSPSTLVANSRNRNHHFPRQCPRLAQRVVFEKLMRRGSLGERETLADGRMQLAFGEPAV